MSKQHWLEPWVEIQFLNYKHRLATPTGWLVIGLRGIATKNPFQNIKHNWGIKNSIEKIFREFFIAKKNNYLTSCVIYSRR